MEDRYLFSIVIPAYNPDLELFSNCLKSLVDQEEKKLFEVLLINDGSQNFDASFLKDFDNKGISIKYFYQDNKGVSAARNFGVMNAIGKYVLFLDCDDIYKENTFLLLKDSAKYDSDLILFNFSKIIKGREVNNPSYKHNQLINNGTEFLRDICTYPGLNLLTNKAIKRSILIDNDIFLNPKLKMAEDVEFLLRYIPYVKSIYILDSYLYQYTIHDSSVSQKYSRNISTEYLKSMEEVYKNDKIQKKYLHSVILDHLIFSVFKELYHPKNPENEKSQIKLQSLLRQDCYRNAIESKEYDLSLKKKIIIFFISNCNHHVLKLLGKMNYRRKY